MNEIRKDTVFYEESGGGVTFSGGEPLMQGDFLVSLVKQSYNLGIHTAIDTSGYGKRKTLEALLPYTNLFLYDIKMLDEKLHVKYTGVSNNIILENFDFLLSTRHEVIIRYPLIPKINDSKEQMDKLISYLMGKVSEIHILPYHAIGNYKYKQVGLTNRMTDTGEPNDDYLEVVKKKFENQGFNITIGG